MQRLILLLLILLLLALVSLSHAIAAPMAIRGPVETVILVTTTAHKNILVFKVNKKFIGAHMEVLSVNGDCITCQKLIRRKTIINLGDALPGTYIIRIQKDGIIENLALPLAP